SRVIRAREDAVNAVSLPAKNAEISRQSTTTTSDSQSEAVIGLFSSDYFLAHDLIRHPPHLSGSCFSKFFGEKGPNLGGIDFVFDKRVADPAHQYEGERSAFYFLVLADQIHQDVNARNSAGHILYLCGQSCRRKMGNDAADVTSRNQAFARREFECQDDAQCHCFPVQHSVRIATSGFERIAER